MFRELGRTVRAAIKGWPSTIRLVTLMVVAATIWVTLGLTVGLAVH